jgi:hypothetical protein
MMCLDPIQANPQSSLVQSSSDVGNDINIMADLSSLQKLSPCMIYLSNGCFVVTTLNSSTGRFHIVKLAEMMQKFIIHCNAKHLCPCQTECIWNAVNRTCTLDQDIPFPNQVQPKDANSLS